MKYHFCRVEISRDYFYRVLNNSSHISLTNIIMNDETFSLDISYKYIDDFQAICKKHNIVIIKNEELGLYKKIFKRTVINNLFIICVMFLFLLIINSFFIWNITIEGNYSNSNEEMIEYINKTINCGMLKNKVNTDKLEEELRNDFENISWVCAEIKGTNLIVHIKETYLSEIVDIEDKPYNIIANKDGQIKSIITRAGIPNVKVGDNIKKGDILISGKVIITDEYEEELFTKYCGADGTITALTSEDINYSLNKKYKYKTIKSINNIYLPTISNYSWKLKLADKNISVERKQIKLWGDFYLPFSIEKYLIEKAEYNDAEYTKYEANNILNNKLLYKLSKMEQKGYKIIKNNVKIIEEENCFKLVGKIQSIEPIGKVDYIDVEKEKEEGTTQVNERN